MSEPVDGFRCWYHVEQPVLFCWPCFVFWSPCCGERHVCPPEVLEEKVAKLREGRWRDVMPDPMLDPDGYAEAIQEDYARNSHPVEQRRPEPEPGYLF